WFNTLTFALCRNSIVPNKGIASETWGKVSATRFRNTVSDSKMVTPETVVAHLCSMIRSRSSRPFVDGVDERLLIHTSMTLTSGWNVHPRKIVLHCTRMLTRHPIFQLPSSLFQNKSSRRYLLVFNQNVFFFLQYPIKIILSEISTANRIRCRTASEVVGMLSATRFRKTVSDSRMVTPEQAKN
ncbi:hypothetical protein ALC57_10233, partial [Trachymyrmex cornetzi]